MKGIKEYNIFIYKSKLAYRLYQVVFLRGKRMHDIINLVTIKDSL